MSAILVLLSFAFLTFAHDIPCEVPLIANDRAMTVGELRERSKERIAQREQRVPRPRFDNIEIASLAEQEGEPAPRAIQDILGENFSLVATPAPTSPDPVSVGLVQEAGLSFPLHLDILWKGQHTSTAAYFTLPKRLRSNGGYIIGPEYKIAQVHLHGGGTPTATGKNGVSIGEKLADENVPVMSVDLFGHGRATRRPDGLLSARDQVEYIWEMVERAIHPSVPVIISGHSYGAMLALVMHRMSADPKFNRIVHFVSMSPGIDPTLGGSPEERLKAQEWYEKNYPQLKKRIAPADFEFLSNIIQNGKDSDVGSLFTALTDLDYSLKPLTAEEQARLKPLTVIVGTADGMVYVGWERQFQELFGNLIPPSKFVLLGPGRTWKSPNEDVPTGHQIFDRYIDGTTKYQVYEMLKEIARTAAGEATPPDAEDPAEKAYDTFLRHYAGFFAFRELMDNHVEYVERRLPYMLELTGGKDSGRKAVIEKYIFRSEELESKWSKETDSKVQKALDELAKDIGLPGIITAERAQSELDQPDLTPQRRAELEAVWSQVEKIDEDLKSSFVDQISEDHLRQLESEFAETLRAAGVTDLNDYKSKMDELEKVKPTNAAEKKVRADLKRLHQKYNAILKERARRYGEERENRIAKLKLPEGIADIRALVRELKTDRSPERRRMLKEYLARMEGVKENVRRIAREELRQRLAEIPRPEGVRDLNHARQIKNEIDARLALVYVPEGDAEIQAIVDRIIDLEERTTAIKKGTDTIPGLDKLESAMDDLRVRHAATQKKWQSLWAKKILTSKIIAELERKYDEAVTRSQEANFHYKSVRNRWLISLNARGELTGERVRALTPEIRRLREIDQRLRREFLAIKEELEKARRDETRNGRLQGPEGAVQEALRVLELERSLAAELRSAETLLESRARAYWKLEAELNHEKFRYVRLMEAKERLPKTIVPVSILALFSRPYDELMRELRENPVALEALQQALAKWEPILTSIRRQNQVNPTDMSSY